MVLALIIFALGKSWIYYYNRGVEVSDDATPIDDSKDSPKESISGDSKILWNQFLIYPIELSKESGGYGPDEIMKHARNLVIINLETGVPKRLFEKKIYIWDYFVGEFTKKLPTKTLEKFTTESVNIGNKIIIIAITEDTNKDGFLNNKDKKSLFLYDPIIEELTAVLPESFYLEKLMYNSKKNTLVLITQPFVIGKEEVKKSFVYVYDVLTKKGQIIAPE